MKFTMPKEQCDKNFLTTLKSNLIVLTIVTLTVPQLYAREPGHYVPGVANIRDLTTPTDPGFYYLQYNAVYSTDDYKDRHGDSVNSLNVGPINIDVTADVDVFAIMPIFMWSTETEFLGAKNTWYIAPSFAQSNVAASLSALNLDGTYKTDTFGLG